ncbi:hypothetical protein DRO34_06920, partial [Candidatus Bathyarchaeota archaeon]
TEIEAVKLKMLKFMKFSHLSSAFKSSREKFVDEEKYNEFYRYIFKVFKEEIEKDEKEYPERAARFLANIADIFRLPNIEKLNNLIRVFGKENVYKIATDLYSYYDDRFVGRIIRSIDINYKEDITFFREISDIFGKENIINVAFERGEGVQGVQKEIIEYIIDKLGLEGFRKLGLKTQPARSLFNDRPEFLLEVLTHTPENLKMLGVRSEPLSEIGKLINNGDIFTLETLTGGLYDFSERVKEGIDAIVKKVSYEAPSKEMNVLLRVAEFMRLFRIFSRYPQTHEISKELLERFEELKDVPVSSIEESMDRLILRTLLKHNDLFSLVPNFPDFRYLHILLGLKIASLSFGYKGNLTFVSIKEKLNSLGIMPNKFFEQMLEAYRIELMDSGNTIAGVNFIEGLIRFPLSLQLEDLPEPLPRQEEIDITKTKIVNNLSEITEGWQFISAQGRTLKFKKEGCFLALKLLKENESPEELLEGLRWFEYINKIKERIGLRCNYPMPYELEGERIWRVKDIPSECKEALATQIDKTGEPIKVRRVRGHFVVTGYITQEEDKGKDFVYLTEPSLTDEEFEEALFNNLHDLFTLARYGIIHTALADLFHNVIQRGRVDRGRYLWMVDIINPMRTRAGSGRLHAWLQAIAYPNLRVAGPRDSDHFALLKDLISEDNPKSVHLVTALSRFSQRDLLKVYLCNYLGEYLLSVSLIVGKRLRERNELDWEKPERLASLMRKVFIQSYYFFTLNYEEAKEISCLINWKRLAQQMAFFMAKGDRYVDYLLKRDIPEEIYNSKTKLEYSEDFRTSRGWIENEEKRGWYFDGENPDLGPVNGPIPLQELIKALYIFSGFMTIALTKQTDFKEINNLPIDRGNNFHAGFPISPDLIDAKLEAFIKEVKEKATAIYSKLANVVQSNISETLFGFFKHLHQDIPSRKFSLILSVLTIFLIGIVSGSSALARESVQYGIFGFSPLEIFSLLIGGFGLGMVLGGSSPIDTNKDGGKTFAKEEFEEPVNFLETFF